MSLLKNQSPLAIAAMKWDTLSSSEKIEIALSILKKPFEERMKEDTTILFKFVEKIQFFRDFDAETIHECCQYLTYFQAKPNQVIFKQGDIGRTFYIILSGSVGVFRDELILDPQIESLREDSPTKLKLGSKINVHFEDVEIKKSIVLLDAQNNPINNNTPAPSTKKRNSTYNTLLLDVLPSNKVPSLTDKRGCVEVSCLTQGTAFGERSLLGKGPRKATIISKGETYFACLDKEHFDKVLKEKQKRTHNENINFFHELQIFKVFSSHLIEQIYYRSIKKKFITNQTVYSENDRSDYIYIIKSGEFKVTKSIEIVDEQDRLFLNRTPDNILGLKKKTPQKIVDVAIYGKGEVFGEEDILLGRNRDNSVYCYSSAGELYMLPKEDFKSLLCSDESFKSCIQNQIDTKAHFHNERLKVATNMANQNKHLLIHLDDSTHRIHTLPTDASINTIINNKLFSQNKAFMSRVRKFTGNGSKIIPLEDLKSSSQLPTDENIASPKASKSVVLKKLINPNNAGDSKIRQYKRAKGVISMNKQIIENLFPEIKKDKVNPEGPNNNSGAGSKFPSPNLDRSADTRSLSENPKSKAQPPQKKMPVETVNTKFHRKTSSLGLSLTNRISIPTPKISPTPDNNSPVLGGSYRQPKLSQTHTSNFFTTMLPSNFVYPIMKAGFASEVSSPAKAKHNVSRNWAGNFMQNQYFNSEFEERDLLMSPKNSDGLQRSHGYSTTFYGTINPLKQKNYKKGILDVQNFMHTKLTGRSAKE